MLFTSWKSSTFFIDGFCIFSPVKLLIIDVSLIMQFGFVFTLRFFRQKKSTHNRNWASQKAH